MKIIKKNLNYLATHLIMNKNGKIIIDCRTEEYIMLGKKL